MERYHPFHRSIPAHAGGTFANYTPTGTMEGLSPPTRGNPDPLGLSCAGRGSIPAHAGEPFHRYESHWQGRVYPRPREGTSKPSRLWASGTGLSPPTRGNPAVSIEEQFCGGSIPAHAGEPPLFPHCPQRRPVYPRPRGGTGLQECGYSLGVGLSPPTQGNPYAYCNRA